MRWILEEITPRSCTIREMLEPPSLEIVRRCLNKEFDERLTSREAAERMLSHMFSAHLGKVTTAKRVLQRSFDHASDIAILAESQMRVESTVLNFVDAFMAVPFHPAEQPYNCAKVHNSKAKAIGVHFVASARLRKNHPYGLRACGKCCCSMCQALNESKECRLQLYVDDPSIGAGGTLDECAREVDVILFLVCVACTFASQRCYAFSLDVLPRRHWSVQTHCFFVLFCMSQIRRSGVF